jgi:hypothetical protein
MGSLGIIRSRTRDQASTRFSPVIVIVVASVTVYVRVPYVKIVGDGHTVV